MGEMAEEAMYIGYAEMDKDYKDSRGRTICVGDPKVDKNYWRDACGKIRCISEMDTMHIALVYKQLENKSGRFYSERKHVFLNELNRRCLTEEDWDMNILGIALGLYCFYPNESDRSIEDYYVDMFRPYFYDNKVHGYEYPLRG